MHITAGDGSIDASFDLTHGTNSEGNATLEVDAVAGDQKVHISNDDVYNFRQYYKSLLGVELQEYTPLTDEEKAALVADPSKLMLTFSYTTTAGEVSEYKFYQYSTRRAFVTLNGNGEFYTYVDMIEKVKNDTEKVLVGMDINSYWKK